MFIKNFKKVTQKKTKTKIKNKYQRMKEITVKKVIRKRNFTILKKS